MDNQSKPLGEFGFKLAPLPLKTAAWLFALLYVTSSAAWMNLPADTAIQVHRLLPLVLLLGLPIGLILFRLLFALFENMWFAIVMIAALTIVSAAAAALLPADAAMALVFRTYPFAALGASLGLSLLACVLKRPWCRSSIPYLGLHIGLIIGIAGGFVSLFSRVEGFVVLQKGAGVGTLTLRDYRLTVAAPDARVTRIPLPFQGTMRGECEATIGTASLRLLYSAASVGDPASLTVLAEDSGTAGTATLFYDGAPQTMNVGAKRYTLSFGPTLVELPFTISFEDASTEYYPGGSLPKSYYAEIAFAPRAAGEAPPLQADVAPANAVPAVRRLEVNAPLSRDGYEIYLYSLSGPDAAMLQVVRDPGAPVLFAGGVLSLASLAWILVRRFRAAADKAVAA